jgi:flagellar protein FliO/FliZ
MLPDLPRLLSAVAALSAVLGVILLGAWLLRRGGFIARPTAGRELAVCETLALDPRRRLHLVRCGNRRVLLLTGGPQDVVVGWPDATPPDQEPPA